MSDRLQIKRATELLVKSVGGIEPAAALLGKSASAVGRWTNKNDAEYSIPVAEMAELEANAPSALVTRALCRLAGGVFVPLPQAPGCDSALPLTVMELASELGQVSGKISEGLSDDGVLDDAEIDAVLRELDDHDAVSARLRLTLEAMRPVKPVKGDQRK